MQQTLYELQTCESYALADIARNFAAIKFNVCWIPSTLAHNQINEKMALSSELLEVVTSQGRNEFNDIRKDE
jgi:hypothetical protein